MNQHIFMNKKVRKTPVIFILTILLLISFGVEFKIAANENDTKLAVVVIDPGHGGKDPGAVAGNAREKDIVLDIALNLGKQIQKNFPDVKVIYTRSNDIFVPLSTRADIANKNKADVFISIHANYVEKGSVEGTETFVLGQHRSEDNLEVAKKENAVILLEDDYTTTYEGFDPNSPESYIMFELVQDEYLEQSVMFASEIQNQFKQQAKRIDRSVKQAGFLVLRRTTMPSVLIEAGFISHPSERSFLLSESGRKKIADSVFAAFADYKQKIETKSSFNLITQNPPVATASNEIAIAPENNRKKQLNFNEGLFYSVQVSATKNNIELKPKNFMGEENVFQKQIGDTYKYYIGRIENYTMAVNEKSRLQDKYPDCFIVAFENGILIPVKKARNKR